MNPSLLTLFLFISLFKCQIIQLSNGTENSLYGFSSDSSDLAAVTELLLVGAPGGLVGFVDLFLFITDFDEPIFKYSRNANRTGSLFGHSVLLVERESLGLGGLVSSTREIVVGEPGLSSGDADSSGPSGRVHIYWGEPFLSSHEILLSPFSQPSDQFGFSLAYHEGMLAAGAPGIESVVIFTHDDLGEWNFSQAIFSPFSPQSRFGEQVVMSETHLIVPSVAGSVQGLHFYRRNESSTTLPWSLSQTFTDSSMNVLFGCSMELGDEGKLLAVSSCYGGLNGAGRVQLWRSTNQFFSRGEVIEIDSLPTLSYFGNSIEIHGTGDDLVMFIGAQGTFNGRGSVFRFDLQDGEFQLTRRIDSPMTTMVNTFGSSISYRPRQDLLFIGSASERTNEGSMYVVCANDTSLNVNECVKRDSSTMAESSTSLKVESSSEKDESLSSTLSAEAFHSFSFFSSLLSSSSSPSSSFFSSSELPSSLLSPSSVDFIPLTIAVISGVLIGLLLLLLILIVRARRGKGRKGGRGGGGRGEGGDHRIGTAMSSQSNNNIKRRAHSTSSSSKSAHSPNRSRSNSSRKRETGQQQYQNLPLNRPINQYDHFEAPQANYDLFESPE